MNTAVMGPGGYTIGDGSWNLHINVTDLTTERVLRVKGDTHIGGVMLKLVEDLGEYYYFLGLIILFS